MLWYPIRGNQGHRTDQLNGIGWVLIHTPGCCVRVRVCVCVCVCLCGESGFSVCVVAWCVHLNVCAPVIEHKYSSLLCFWSVCELPLCIPFSLVCIGMCACVCVYVSNYMCKSPYMSRQWVYSTFVSVYVCNFLLSACVCLLVCVCICAPVCLSQHHESVELATAETSKAGLRASSFWLDRSLCCSWETRQQWEREEKRERTLLLPLPLSSPLSRSLAPSSSPCFFSSSSSLHLCISLSLSLSSPLFFWAVLSCLGAAHPPLYLSTVVAPYFSLLSLFVSAPQRVVAGTGG